MGIDARSEQQLMAISPVDGRYYERTDELRPIVSEFGLIKYRVAVETGWLSVLGSGVLPNYDPMPDQAHEYLTSVVDNFSYDDAHHIKDIERQTNHDVKAVELWLKETLKGTAWERVRELVHFGCTSEDINNLAYAMMLNTARSVLQQPTLQSVEVDLERKADQYSHIPMLARTHGQPATPTTLGKEMEVFASRIDDSSQRLAQVAILGKFNGASGNYNAVRFAYPGVDWLSVNERYVRSLGFGFNASTTQIEPHDWMVTYFNEVAHGNSILRDLATDMWAYISNGTFKLRVVDGEVGSSTMPHKVNPIDFENAEGSFEMANGQLRALAEKLPVSRLQRDLSDSVVQRYIGPALATTLVGYKSVAKGLSKVDPNEAKIAAELNSDWSVLTEALQTVMRKHGVTGAYETIKNASRGKVLDKKRWVEMVGAVDLPDEDKTRLLELEPATYLGYATEF